MSEPIVELRLWRQFIALAEELHFGRAALRLHMTQPPLTQAIALLERRLGLLLFERTRRSVALTPAGQALLPEARELLARAAALPAHARAAAGGEVGRLRLAFVSTAGYELLPLWVRAFRERHPRVQLDLLEATGDLQLQALERGDIDAGLMLHSPGFAPPGLERALIAREPLVVALPEHHPLATATASVAASVAASVTARASGSATQTPSVPAPRASARKPTPARLAATALPLEAVLAEPLVIFPRRILPSVYDAVFALYHAAGRSPQVVQEAIQMQTIVNLVSAGLGLAWVPGSVMRFQRPGVVYREVASRPARGRRAAQQVPACETSLVWRADGASPTLARFVAFAREQAGATAAEPASSPAQRGADVTIRTQG
jgi:DNA-binding transcriptional LysR family regulator